MRRATLSAADFCSRLSSSSFFFSSLVFRPHPLSRSLFLSLGSSATSSSFARASLLRNTCTCQRRLSVACRDEAKTMSSPSRSDPSISRDSRRRNLSLESHVIRYDSVMTGSSDISVCYFRLPAVWSSSQPSCDLGRDRETQKKRLSPRNVR